MLNKLSDDTARLIGSTQVVSCISTAVKELVENSVDAGASTIEIRLEDYGHHKIQVRDNGSGIKVRDMPYAAQRHYTSKITSDNDLLVLSTFGFRGEALSSICGVAQVSISTRTKDDLHSTIYVLDSQGHVKSSKPCHAPVGSTVYVTELFKQLPVRKRFFSSLKKKKEQLKLTEDILMAIALAYPPLQISLYNDKTIIWQKPRVSTHRAALTSVLSSPITCTMQEKHAQSDDGSIEITTFFPKSHIIRKTSDHCFVIINKRPVRVKQIDKLLRHIACDSVSSGWPVCLVIIKVPSSTVDANINPSKTEVVLSVIDQLSSLLSNMIQAEPSSSPTGLNNCQSENVEQETENKAERIQVHGKNKMFETEQQSAAFYEKRLESENSDSCEQDAGRHVSIAKNMGGLAASDEAQLCFSNSDQQTACTSSSIACGDEAIPCLLQQSSVKGDEAPDLMHEPCNSEGNLLQTSSCPNDPELLNTDLELNSCKTDNKSDQQMIFGKSLADKGDFNPNVDFASKRLSGPANCKQMRVVSCLPDVDEEKVVAKWSRGEAIQNTNVQPIKVLSSFNHNALHDPSNRKRSCAVLRQNTLDDMLEGTVVKKTRQGAQKDVDMVLNNLREDSLPSVSPSTLNGKVKDKCKSSEQKQRKSRNSFMVYEQDQQVESDNENTEIIKRALDFSIETLRTSIHEAIAIEQKLLLPSKKISANVIGFIKNYKSAIVCIRTSLYLVNLFRLQECLVLINLLERHNLPCVELDQWVEITELNASKKGIEVLETLKTKETSELNPDQDIIDERIAFNGFKIRRVKDKTTGKNSFLLFSMTLSVPYYSVADLKDVLLKLHQNIDLSLKDSRPSKLLYYLQGEAARITRSAALCHDASDIQHAVITLLERNCAEQHSISEIKCFHNKNVFYKLPSCGL